MFNFGVARSEDNNLSFNPKNKKNFVVFSEMTVNINYFIRRLLLQP